MRLSLPTAAVAFSLLALASAQSASDLPVHVVRIDLIASNARGDVVTSLKPADFDLREDGVPRSIEGLRFGSPTPRLVAIFLDEYHVTAGEGAARARAALTRFVDQDLSPDALIVVMKPLDSLFAIRATRDHDAARRAIASFEGRRGDYTPRNAYEKDYIAESPDRVEAARVQVVVSAINALAAELGRLDDSRKTVIVVTEALGRPVRSRGREYLATVETIVRAANSANVSIYSVNPTPASPTNPPTTPVGTGDGAGRESMQTIASLTDGESVGEADLDAGLRRIARDSRGYYLLTFRSAHKEDGQFHPVQVRIRNPAIRVRARAGYWAPSPEDVLRARLREEAAHPPPPVPIEPAHHISPLIRPWFGLSRAENGKTRVTFVWEPAGRVPGDRTRHYPSRLILTALGTDDSVIFKGPVLPSGSMLSKTVPVIATAATGAGTLATGVVEEPAARAVFDVPPGKVRLRMQVEDEAEQVIDSDVRDLAVHEWHSAIALGTPEVLRARNALEFRALVRDPDAAPVASREFSRTERLLIRFVAYGPEGADKAVTAKLLARSGQRMRDLNVQAELLPDGRNQMDLPLAGLAPGEYSLELTATSGAGQAIERMPFRVTN